MLTAYRARGAILALLVCPTPGFAHHAFAGA